MPRLLAAFGQRHPRVWRQPTLTLQGSQSVTQLGVEATGGGRCQRIARFPALLASPADAVRRWALNPRSAGSSNSQVDPSMRNRRPRRPLHGVRGGANLRVWLRATMLGYLRTSRVLSWRPVSSHPGSHSPAARTVQQRRLGQARGYAGFAIRWSVRQLYGAWKLPAPGRYEPPRSTGNPFPQANKASFRCAYSFRATRPTQIGGYNRRHAT